MYSQAAVTPDEMKPEKERLEAPPNAEGISNGLLAGPSAILPFICLFALLYSFTLFLAVLATSIGFVVFVVAVSMRIRWLSAIGVVAVAGGIFWITRIV